MEGVRFERDHVTSLGGHCGGEGAKEDQPPAENDNKLSLLTSYNRK